MSNRYGLAIRAAHPSDAEGVAALFASAGASVTREAMAARLAASLDQPGALLLADEWGPPAGLIAAHWRSVLTADLKQGTISTLLVAPERRRNGIARLLLKAASQAARTAGCGELSLDVPPEASDLRAFCEATGFAPAGARFVRALRKRG
ncbi:GNAT family N-acetyltransferase [uncultured Caulobacter sp.]|uniref:GNAT family N-acetyltransferase n=1 Tax=uncultured Caulobacter sp. TaxID=158749 RepID=UPI00262F68BD|nr:GNAT family N-acetyltransferase [uncultured Caulobacter sp.]